MNDFELGWVCGLLEGEGCFHQSARKGRNATQTRIHVLMTDRDVVEKFARLVGVTANIWTVIPKGKREGCKPLYGTMLSGHAAIRLMKLVLPHMGKRRAEKINSILNRWTQVSHRLPRGQRLEPWIALGMTRSTWYHNNLHKAEIRYAR